MSGESHEGSDVQHITIDADMCDRSPACPARRVCPRGAIKPLPGGRYPGSSGYVVDSDRCTACGVCIRACPGGAVHLG
jgi:Fe-S-cluster-containing hydrogenase component 2